MAFFETLTTSLKQRWLQFFQLNRSWIAQHMEVESVYTSDGGRRPPSYLILGVINALEPELAELMVPFSKLNPDADALIDALELNFDPDLVLGNRLNPQEVLIDTVIEALTEVQLDELSDISLDEMAAPQVLADEVVFVEGLDDTILVLTEVEPDASSGDMSLDEIANAIGLMESDEESLDPSPAQPDEFSDILSSPAQPDEVGDVLSDVWGEETSSEPNQVDDETLLGEDKQSEQDQEISRLFPNF